MPTIEHELQHEEAMIQQGIASYRNQYSHLMSQNRLSDTRPGSRLLKGSAFDLAQDIERHLTHAMSGKPGRHNKAASLMVTLDAGVMAYCTVKGLVNALTKPTPITRVAKMVATLLEDQVRFTAFKKAEPSTFYHLIEEYKRRTGHPTYKRASLSGHMDRLNFEWQPWPMDAKIHVGLTLVELAIQATGMATIKDRKEKGKSQKLVVPTEKTLAWIRDFNTYHEALGPHYLPMLVEPKPWTGPKEGGYYLPTLEMPIVKGAKSGQLHHYDTMPLVYQALNTLQQSSWRINQKTLAIMHEVWENNRSLGKLPTKAPMPVPPCPLPRELNQKQMNKVQQELFEQWKFQASQIHNRNAELNGKRIQVELTLQTARKMSQHPRFWFPYNLDFRGRIYAIPGLLNPQGSDWAKGLLLFSEGKPIETEEQAHWLAIHGANCYGYDKVSFEDRIQWIKEHQDVILSIVSDPLEHTQWSQADKPWQFLAFCFEWAEYLAQGFGFVSFLPVALDGSCNGLQHFSAMLRDAVGGHAVNLVPCARPQDIYQMVADRTVEKLTALARKKGPKGGDKLLALQWLEFGVNRTMTKRPVMVLPYGGTKRSCCEYVLEHWKEQVEAGRENPFRQPHKAASWLAELIWASIEEVVVAAPQVMSWLQKIARLLTKANRPIVWTAPSGFRVEQAYKKLKESRLKIRLFDKTYAPKLTVETASLDPCRQANGISPNFIHSMDAAALVLFVVKAQQAGLRQLAMIHDSYGTLAADVPQSFLLLREAFVSMYRQHDVLNELILSNGLEQQMEPILGGTLDLEQIKASLFFFD